ncbi:DUF3114 domain-containing protein [Enterococcus sp. UD-01]|jgi:hypothetical protein|uniref:DUF3114 domain-containing protein n=1 Tax=Enterococcus sp. UD-01 TaxID=3373911 RepID=UPI003833D43F
MEKLSHHEKVQKSYYLIEPPANLSLEDQALYNCVVTKQINELQLNGWDPAALTTYANYLKQALEIAEPDIAGSLSAFYQQTYLVGSALYEKLFCSSQLSDKDKIFLVIRQLGGFLNEQNDLELAETQYTFDPELAPGAAFLHTFSETVQRAYPKGLKIAAADQKLSKATLKKKYPQETMLHQFRHQLDKHNIWYVKNYRQSHQLATDEVAIKAILKDNWFYADPHYHNRALLGTDITAKDRDQMHGSLTNRGLLKKISKRGFYRKILSGDYHSEFIVDEAGALISQWQITTDEKAYQVMPIANGESFNYGKRPRFDPTNSHQLLDGVPPHYFDSDKRLSLKKQWVAPTDNWFYQLIRRLAEYGIRFKRKKNNRI